MSIQNFRDLVRQQLVIGSIFLFLLALWPEDVQAEALYIQKIYHQISGLQREVEQIQQRLDNHELSQETVVQEMQRVVRTVNDAAPRTYMDKQTKDIVRLSSDIKALKTCLQDIDERLQSVCKIVQEQGATIIAQEKQIQSLSKAMRALALSIQKTSGVTEEVYHVKTGDSLEKIAKEHRCSVQAIREINKLKGDVIRPGQVLQIPIDTK